MKGEPLVGLASDISLSRRVQLAVLAHIRHKHTRYDNLLREANYLHARKAVEQLCLDILVKWRGDEETGRDQLDEILREVIVISDSEDESDDESSDDHGSDHDSAQEATLSAGPVVAAPPLPDVSNKKPGRRKGRPPKNRSRKGPQAPTPKAGHRGQDGPSSAKRDQRGFKRYQAARLARWDETRDRLRHEEVPDKRPGDPAPMLRSGSHSSPQQNWPPHPDAPPLTFAQPVGYLTAGRTATAPENRPPVMGPNHPASRADKPGNPTSVSLFNRPAEAVVRGHGRALSGHSWTGSEPPPPAVHRRQPTPRAVVRSEHLQDYLVPSVEPPSPGFNRPPPPGFAPTVPPPRHYDDRAGMPASYARRSPAEQHASMDEPNKRRRIVDQHSHPVGFTSAFGSNPSTVHTTAGGDWTPREPARVIPLWEPYRERLARPSALASKTHFVDADGAVLREEYGRPIVVEDWAVEPSRGGRRPAPRSYEKRVQEPRAVEFIEISRPVYAESQLPEGHRIISIERVQAPPRGGYGLVPVGVPVGVPVEYMPAAEAPMLTAPPPERRPLRPTTNSSYVDSPTPIFIRRVGVDDPLASRLMAPVRHETFYVEGARPSEPPRREYIPHQ